MVVDTRFSDDTNASLYGIISGCFTNTASYKSEGEAHLFSRQGSILDLSTLLLYEIYSGKKSYQSNLVSFFHEDGLIPRKSTYAESKSKLSLGMLDSLNDCLLSSSKSQTGFKPVGGFSSSFITNSEIYGLDGSTFYLPQTPKMIEAYGGAKNQYGFQCFSRVSCLLHVNTGLCQGFKVGKGNLGEAHLTDSLLSELSPDTEKNTIVVMDRLYPGWLRMRTLEKKNIHFVVRSKASWNKESKEFMASELNDSVVEVKASKNILTDERTKDIAKTLGIKSSDTLKVRFIRIMTKTGEESLIVTNILEKEASSDEIIKIYALRWACETFFDVLKNKIRVENYSGHAVETVEKDHQVAIIKYNLLIIIKNHAQEVLDKQDNAKLKYVPKINTALLTTMIPIFLKSLATEDQKKSRKTFDLIIQQAVALHEPQRPNRSNPRKHRNNKTRGKCWYYANYKMTA